MIISAAKPNIFEWKITPTVAQMNQIQLSFFVISDVQHLLL